MKQELESELALEIQPLNQCDEVVPTPTSEIDAGSESQLMFSVHVSENPGCIFNSSVVNGYIVYTRTKKSRHLCNGSSDNGSIKRLRTSEDREPNADLPDVGGGDDVEVNNAEKNFDPEVVCHLEKRIRCTELKNEPAQFLAGEGGPNKVPAELFNNNEVQKHVDKTVKRFTRSALKPKVECSDKTGTAREAAQTANNRPDEKETAALSASTTPINKVELKMSKKIVLSKKPMTVKELFDSGLLDGVSVVYTGGKASGLGGVITDGGILCSCYLCNGLKVIPPSQFEIHACKSYRRAAQYICFENGKSLLELLRACRGTPLLTLETTIQNFVCSPPQEKNFACKKCKGCFPSSRVNKVGPICKTCVESKESEASLIDAVGKRVRSPRSVPAPKPSSDSGLCNSSQINKHWKKRTRTTNRVSCSKSSETASVPIPSRKKSMQRLKKSTKTSVKVEAPLISSDAKCLSSQNKSQWKITKKDQRLHKLVFEEGGLPDGTEVAYYGRGQKLLEGYKKGFGILCRCCNTEVSPSQFEVHAGWASHRKPYAYIYTSNGVSLHELAISLSKGRKYAAKDNDDVCIICLDGGNLLLCDGCPRAFHKGQIYIDKKRRRKIMDTLSIGYFVCDH